MPWEIKQEGEEFVVVKKDGSKVVGKHKTRAEANAQLKALYANVKENVTFEFITGCEITEAKESNQLSIGGTALVECISENNRKYTFQNILENNNKSFKWLVGHPSTEIEDHVVGKGELIVEAGRLKHKGMIMNTARHPDVCQKVKEGLLGPSIHASAKKVIKEEDGSYTMEGLSIDGIGLVAFQGVKSASIDYAISESFDKKESMKVDEDINNDAKGEIKMEEIKQPVVETVSKETYEAVLNELNAMKEAKKTTIVESILALNKEMKKEDLIKESEDKLNMILAYETKLSAKPKVQESVAVVETKEEVKKTEDVIVESKEGDISVSESAYKKFNEEIMSRIR